MNADQTAAKSEPLRWAWVGVAVVLGAVLISFFVAIVDSGLERPGVVGLVTTLSLILVGILVGYHSTGETIREAAVAAVILVGLAWVTATWIVETQIPTVVWLLSPFYAALLAMAGAWVGEMLQGTLDEAHEDEVIDWPWVFVSVVIGFTLSAYLVSLGQALYGLTPFQGLFVFAASFLVTGWIVGYYSPGVTMVEPAIAAGLMVVLDAGFVILWFEALSRLQILLIGFLAGIALAYLGGWLGEMTQRRIKGAPAE